MDIGLAFVDEECLLIHRAVIGTDNNFVGKPDNKLLLPINLETNLNKALLHEKYFLDFLKFVEQNGVGLAESGFKFEQDGHHEFSIGLIFPVVVSVLHGKTFLDFILACGIYVLTFFDHPVNVVLLRDSEDLDKLMNEFLEEELVVDSVLDL